MNYKIFSRAIHDQAMQNKIPIDGSFEITYRCNLKCVQCYALPLADEKSELSTEEISRILDELAQAGCLWLLLTGGEPLIRKDFKEIFIETKKKGFIITLFTNGTLITEEIATFFKEYPPFYIELTMYGASKEIYESITRVRGSYEKYKNGIALLKKFKIPFRLKTLLMKLNEHELPGMEEFAKEIGVEFTFDPIINPALNKDQTPCSYRMEPEKIARIDYNDKKRHQAWLKTLRENDKNTDHSFKCGGGWVSFSIDPNGKISPCLMSRKNTYDLKEISFKDAWNKFSPEYLSKSFMALDKCKTCDVSAFCDRCPGSEFLESGNDKSKYECEIANERAKLFVCSSKHRGEK
jgi:radical SAM protein with 4Fe4S-binding SPASM domain